MLNKFENYLKLNVTSKKTIKTYLKVIRKFFKHYRNFNQGNVNNYLQQLVEDKKSENYFNLNVAVFKSYCRFSKIEIEFPKARKINHKRPVFLSRDEIEEEIFPYFDSVFNDPEKRKLVVRFMMLSLLRISEVVNLKKENIDFKTGSIKLIGKGNKERITVLHESIAKAFEEEVNKSNTEYALNVSTSYIEYIFRRINEEIGYKKHLTPHTLRRSGAKYLRKSGVDVEDIKDILGHESLDTTYLYIMSDEEEIKEAFKKVKYKIGVTKKGKK